MLGYIADETVVESSLNSHHHIGIPGIHIGGYRFRHPADSEVLAVQLQCGVMQRHLGHVVEMFADRIRQCLSACGPCIFLQIHRIHLDLLHGPDGEGAFRRIRSVLPVVACYQSQQTSCCDYRLLRHLFSEVFQGRHGASAFLDLVEKDESVFVDGLLRIRGELLDQSAGVEVPVEYPVELDGFLEVEQNIAPVILSGKLRCRVRLSDLSGAHDHQGLPVV